MIVGRKAKAYWAHPMLSAFIRMAILYLMSSVFPKYRVPLSIPYMFRRPALTTGYYPFRTTKVYILYIQCDVFLGCNAYNKVLYDD